MNIKKNPQPLTYCGQEDPVTWAALILLSFQLWLGIHSGFRPILQRIDTKKNGERGFWWKCCLGGGDSLRLDMRSAPPEWAGGAKQAQPDSGEQWTLRPSYEGESDAQKVGGLLTPRSWNKPLGVWVTKDPKGKQIGLRTTVKFTVWQSGYAGVREGRLHAKYCAK